MVRREKYGMWYMIRMLLVYTIIIRHARLISRTFQKWLSWGFSANNLPTWHQQCYGDVRWLCDAWLPSDTPEQLSTKMPWAAMWVTIVYHSLPQTVDVARHLTIHQEHRASANRDEKDPELWHRKSDSQPRRALPATGKKHSSMSMLDWLSRLQAKSNSYQLSNPKFNSKQKNHSLSLIFVPVLFLCYLHDRKPWKW